MNPIKANLTKKWMRLGTRLLFVFVLFLVMAKLSGEQAVAQGKLGRARSATRAKDPTKKRAAKSRPPKTTREASRKEKKDNASVSAISMLASVVSEAGQNPKEQPEPKPKAKPKPKAGGRLDRVSEATRKNKPAKKSGSPKRHRSRHSSHRHSRPHYHHSIDPLFTFHASEYCQPPTVYHSVEVYQPSVQALPAVEQPLYSRQIAAPNVSQPAFVEPAVSAPDAHEPAFAEDWFDQWAVRMTALYGSDFDDLSVTGLDLLIAPPGAIGFETSVNHLLETGVDFRSHLWIGDANLVYELLGDGPLRGRVGIGANWLGDSIGVEFGLNLTAGFDLHLNERWTITGQADIGSLGDADFSHTRLDIGRRFGVAEWVVGYDHYDINGVDIGNWVTGLRLRY